jgi:hypothetical protein
MKEHCCCLFLCLSKDCFCETMTVNSSMTFLIIMLKGASSLSVTSWYYPQMKPNFPLEYSMKSNLYTVKTKLVQEFRLSDSMFHFPTERNTIFLNRILPMWFISTNGFQCTKYNLNHIVTLPLIPLEFSLASNMS